MGERMETRQPGKYDAVKAFEELPEGARAELIDGAIVDMGSPSQAHQAAAIGIAGQLFNQLLGKKCQVRYEFDVQLDEKNSERIFRPDVIVVCDPAKMREHRVVGAPDFIAEVLSPSTRSRDTVTKLNRYKDAGVREYWLVDPEAQTVIRLVMSNGVCGASSYGAGERVPVTVLSGCEIDLSLVFPPAGPITPQAEF